ncbi:UNVERIFIED_CONTAM: hypothetical protein HDU68_008547 [Siphonaria sp. JEL0065]|nr:hypothetical protein HDU68_008547 [Siphonaria sp. JEL0065]
MLKTPCTNCQEYNSQINADLAKIIRLERIVTNAMEEINGYRRLLYLEPLENADVFADPEEPVIPATVIKREVKITSLPRELLDKILPYLDSESIMPLCHSIRHFKPISEAIHDIQVAFKTDVTDIWPEFYFPRVVNMEPHQSKASAPLEIIPKHLFKVFRISNLLTKYGGSATILPGSQEYISNISTLLPSRINIHSPTDAAEYTYEGRFDLFMKSLTTIKPKPLINLFEFPTKFDGITMNGLIMASVTDSLSQLRVREMSFSSVIPPAVARTLPRVQGLTIIRVEDAGADFPSALIKTCLELRKLEFEFPSFSMRKLKELVGLLKAGKMLDGVYFRYIDLSQAELKKVSREMLESVGWRYEEGVYNQGEFVVWRPL